MLADQAADHRARGQGQAPTAAQMPMAMLRSLTLVNVAMMMASVVGISSAAPTPWTARLAISTPPLPASPAASEDSGEQGHADQEQPAPPVHVGEPAADQQQPGQR